MITDIWSSFRRLPVWVQVWVGGILVPVNLIAMAFWQQPAGPWLTFLAVGGMAPNLIVMVMKRGFSKSMALSHVVLWPPLLVVILWQLGGGAEGAFRAYLLILLVVDVISLGFDIPDTVKWWRGDRAIA